MAGMTCHLMNQPLDSTRGENPPVLIDTYCIGAHPVLDGGSSAPGLTSRPGRCFPVAETPAPSAAQELGESGKLVSKVTSVDPSLPPGTSLHHGRKTRQADGSWRGGMPERRAANQGRCQSSKVSGRWRVERNALRQRVTSCAWQAKPFSHHAIISPIAQRGNAPGS
jgi:hypothetical protein